MYASYGVTSVVSMGSEQPLIWTCAPAAATTVPHDSSLRRGVGSPESADITTARHERDVPTKCPRLQGSKDVAELAAQVDRSRSGWTITGQGQEIPFALKAIVNARKHHLKGSGARVLPG
jgi:hypothetical protein